MIVFNGQKIGPGQPVFIVGEIGINHNGDTDIALQLMHHIKEAGADAVKFQKRVPRESVPRGMWDKTRETPWGIRSYIDYKEDLERINYRAIDAEATRLGIPWFASAWDVPSVNFLEAYGMPAYKIASACLTNEALLDALCLTQKPLILSTGMSTEAEILHTVEYLRRHKAEFILCHCNSSYPAPVDDLNLRRIETLKRMFPDVPIGYSGHEVGLGTTLAAVALGACYIERHITLDRSMWGSDQAASVEPQGFHHLIKDIRNIERALGTGIIQVTPLEEKKRSQLRGEGEQGKVATSIRF